MSFVMSCRLQPSSIVYFSEILVVIYLAAVHGEVGDHDDLSAVPDGAIMLFSGLGPDAQNQLSVGVGALAGSTIMLLTVPLGAPLTLAPTLL